MTSGDKTCIDCGTTKLFEDFPKRKDSPDGYRNSCKNCKRNKDKANYAKDPKRKVESVREWREKNFDRYTEYNKEYWQRTKEAQCLRLKEYYQVNKDKFRGYNKSWKIRNRTRYLEINANYRVRNRTKINERCLAHYYSNKDKYLDHYRRRRARLLNSEGHFTTAEFRDLCSVYNNVCLCCGATSVKLTADHVVPISRGGKNTIDNIQPLCSTCNKKKNTKMIDYRVSSTVQGVLK